MKSRILLRYLGTVAGLMILPQLMGNPYSQHILNMAFIYVILAISVNLVFGYTGAMTFAHVAVYAIGAYVSALASTQLKLPFLACFVLSGCGGFLVGVFIGYPTLKLAGPYFAMATIGFHKIMEVVFINWESVTGGPPGISRIPHASIAGITLKTDRQYYYLLVAVTLAVFAIYRSLIRSHVGKTVTAMRDNAVAAGAMGINVTRLRLSVFTLSAVFAALAGSLYAHMVRYVAPGAFPMEDSLTLLIMVVLGGPGFLMGPIYGSVVVVLANEYLQRFENLNMLIFGIAIMILLVFLPSGLAGLWERVKLWRTSDALAYVREVGIEEMK